MGRKLALLIGVSRYDDAKLRRLKKPSADVASLAAALRNEQIGAFDAVETSVDEPFAVVLRRIARLFATTGHEDLLLLYYAGHGVKDEQGKLHLATTDTDSTILTATAVGADYLTSVMNGSRSRKQLLILDCCFSGAMTGMRASPNVDAASTFDDASGRIIFTATDNFQYAWEDDTALSPINSVFTHHLVEGLTTGKADRDQDGVVTVDEWYVYTYEGVRAATPKQTPQRSVSRGIGTFPIAKNPFMRIPLPSDVTVPMMSVLPSVREAAVSELARLLADSRLSESAREALDQLARDRDSKVRSAATRALRGEGEANEAPPTIIPPSTTAPTPQTWPTVSAPTTPASSRRLTTAVLTLAFLIGAALVYFATNLLKPQPAVIDTANHNSRTENTTTSVTLTNTSSTATETTSSAPPSDNTGTTSSPATTTANAPPYDQLVAELHTTAGEIDIRFFPSVAPNHVSNFIDLAKKGFYNGIKFHRVIPGFMIQGGDPNTISGPRDTWGTGGSSKTLQAEFNDVPHVRGIVSMARTNDPNSASSQFFICVANDRMLDKQYTVFGEVTKGMDVADRIVNAKRDSSDRPLNPVSIERVGFHVESRTLPVPKG